MYNVPEIIKNLSPILMTAIMIFVIAGSGRQMWLGKKLDAIWIVAVGCLLMIFVKNPDKCITVVEGILSIGGKLNV